MRDPAALDAQRILVVAPHPDDESLGCGGLIATLGSLGRSFHTVFVTDGGASHPNSLVWPRARLAAEREREAIEALRRLGIAEHPRTFLRLPDAAMPMAGSPGFDAALDAMRETIRAFAPDLALLPWRRDPHRDHRDAWGLAMAALHGAAPDTKILEYAIWLDEIGALGDHPHAGEAERVVFDVEPVLAQKRAAVAAHLSQTTDMIGDDPDAFRLTPETIRRLCGPGETYWRPVA